VPRFGNRSVAKGFNPMTRMGPAPALGRRVAAGFGMGSVGEGGSVGPSERRYLSSAFLNRNSQLVVRKIRVSMVRFRPWRPLLTR
jgi:hypothetical protein